MDCQPAAPARQRESDHDVRPDDRRRAPDARPLHSTGERPGIGFILLFYLCNPPFIGYFYAIPTEGTYLIVNKNLVELCALVVILLTGTGRFAGLDAILHGLFVRRPRLRRRRDTGRAARLARVRRRDLESTQRATTIAGAALPSAPPPAAGW